jgi:hypothetical protein
VLLVIGTLALYFKPASATFLGNAATVAWGQGATTSSSARGRISLNHYSFGSPGAFGTRFTQTQVANSAIQFVATKASPTRNEKMIGFQLNNGSLYIDKCTGTCSAGSDLGTNMWNRTILGSGVVTKAFDIAYEQGSGRTMVVYAGNTTGKLYYCIYDGTSWGPVSNCAPTNGVNDITLSDGTTTLTGTPEWVRLVAQGEQFPDTRSNNILLAVQDTNKNIMVIRWNGSVWVSTDRQVLTTTGGATVATSDSGNVDSPAVDVGWESTSGKEMAVYANGTALSYRTSTGSGWGSATTISTLSSAAQWIRVASDTHSNRMSMIVAFGSSGTVGSSATATPYIWKTDGSTTGWTALTNLTMAQDAGQNVSTAWAKANSGTPEAFFSASANANTQQPDWSSWTQGGGLVAWASLVTTSGDIIVGNELAASPNSDIMTMMQNDRDGKLRARTFNGSAWGALITTGLSTTLVNTATGQTSNKTYTQKAYQHTYNPYSAWSFNWRVYDDENTVGSPGVALAPEGVTPQVTPNNIVRLRMSYAELGGNGEGDTRKKLQFSSGAGCPDSSSCTWTDVGAQGSGSAWRYATGGVADNAAVTSTVLDNSTIGGYEVTNGTASASGDQQNANDIQEYDYTLQNNGGTLGTTYYFRGYDYGPSVSGGSNTNLNPILREQILNTSGTEATNCTTNGTASNCTYPSMESFTSAPQAPIIYAPLNGDTNVADSPAIQLRTSDQQADYVQYVIEWCPTNSWPCSAGGGSFDQTATQNGWSGQNANSGTAYATSGVNESGSSMGEYSVSPGVLTPNTTYYLRAKAIDPGGSDTFSTYSSTYGFTTAPQDVRIQGGTNINGGTTIQ